MTTDYPEGTGQFQRAYSDALIEKLESARKLTEWLLDHQPKRYKASDRNRIATAFFSIALEHHVAIVHLLCSRMTSPAFTLARSVWEGYARGLWAVELATDQQLSDFIAGRFEPKMDGIMKGIRKHPDAKKDDIIPRLHQLAWDALNSFDHGGALQIQRWITAESVEAAHSEGDIMSLLRFVNQAAFLAAVSLVEIAEAAELHDTFIEKAKELSSRDWS